MRARRVESLRAGVCFNRMTQTEKTVTWNDDVEAMLFPHLYPFGYGGFNWTSRHGIAWEEHIEKRLWNVNPMFRHNTIFVIYLFDISEKQEMHRAPGRSFVPDGVSLKDAEEFNFMSEANAQCMEAVWRKDLGRGRRGIATASECISKPNVFQTETMNIADMNELEICSYRLFDGDALHVDDVNTACLYKKRQIAIVKDILPYTGLNGVEYGSLRLEIQSGRSYRLHSHNILKVSAEEEELFECISASLSSLPDNVRERYAPLSRHFCLSYKCKSGSCIYGYPVLEGSPETKRFVDGNSPDGRIIYKREIGSKYFPCALHKVRDCREFVCMTRGEEMDERVVPFCPELTNVRNCHGAFLVCNDELATGYSGKYTFKRSGGMGVNTGNISVRDILTQGEVQLLQKDKSSEVMQDMKEYLSIRTVSMMKICLKLCGESIVYSTFHVRELWIVLPHEQKKYVDGGRTHQGIPGGAQLRDYYRRKACYENDTIEAYYRRGEVTHPSDKERKVRCGGTYRGGGEYVYVDGEEKRLLSKIMPIRGEGRRLAELSAWCAILRNVPHRSVKEVWKFEEGEFLWDAAAKCGALGTEYVSTSGLPALIRSLQLSLKVEMSFCTKMGMKEVEKENVQFAFEKAAETVMRFSLESNDHVATYRSAVDDSACITTIGHLGAPVDGNDVFDQNNNADLLDLDRLRVSKWRNRFKARGWKINDQDPDLRNGSCRIADGGMFRTEGSTEFAGNRRSVIADFPANVKRELRALLEYPSQARACLEILDSIVSYPTGLKRFVTGAAGKGKSFVKKTLIRILRSAGLSVKVIANAAIVAQDDVDGQGTTVASAFNRRVADTTFDKLALMHAKTDVFLFDEISFASYEDGRAITEYLSRGQYMRDKGCDLGESNDITQNLCQQEETRKLLADDDPYFGANIIVFGDFMQLPPPGGDPIFRSERLWGNVFRRNTLFLVESVRSSDPELIRLCELCRKYSEEDHNSGKEIVRIVRSRMVRDISETPVGTTILSPRFKRAQEFASRALAYIDEDDSCTSSPRWSKEINTVSCDDYVVRNKCVSLEECIGMDNEELLESKKAVLDKDHTRLRHFVFRIGMIAVVTENSPKKTSEILKVDNDIWPDLNHRNMNLTTPVITADSGTSRLLNSERVKIIGILRQNRGDRCGLKVESADGRWNGEMLIRKTVSKNQGLRSSSALESRSVRFIRNGKEQMGVVTRSQVPLILEIGLTVHKAQGMTLRNAMVDLGCASGAYVGGLLYTAITRVRSLSNLWFIDVPSSDDMILRAIKSCPRSAAEMKRCEIDSENLKQQSILLLQQLMDVIQNDTA